MSAKKMILFIHTESFTRPLSTIRTLNSPSTLMSESEKIKKRAESCASHKKDLLYVAHRTLAHKNERREKEKEEKIDFQTTNVNCVFSTHL
jgi:hypothetical protein